MARTVCFDCGGKGVRLFFDKRCGVYEPIYCNSCNGSGKMCNDFGHALQWWNKLTKQQQRNYEMEMFGNGEYWEVDSLCDEDIAKMFERYV